MLSKSGKEPTIFILYIPGGGILGLIPAMILDRIEELAEGTPIAHLFHEFDGVSIGTSLIAALNVRDPEKTNYPKYTARDCVNMCLELWPAFFPKIQNRYAKMVTSNIFSLLEDFTDPERVDSQVLLAIRKSLEKLEPLAKNDEQKSLLNSLRAASTKRWFYESTKRKALHLCDFLAELNGDMAAELKNAAEYIFVRDTTGTLGAIFRSSVMRGMDMIRHLWAEKFLFDPEVIKNGLEKVFGSARMSDALRTMRISAFDIGKDRKHTFTLQKANVFSCERSRSDYVSDNDLELLDAVMACTANPFALPPYLTENGILCSDKASVHSPLPTVLDVIRKKPANAKVRLVVMGTGYHISNKPENVALRDEYVRYGVIGNFARGRELGELTAYMLTDAYKSIIELLGSENVTVLSPRLSAQTDDELDDVPSRDILDASPENLEKAVRLAKKFIETKDAELKSLTLALVENMYVLGQMDKQKYLRISRNLKAGDPDPSCAGNGEDSNVSPAVKLTQRLKAMFRPEAETRHTTVAAETEMKETTGKPLSQPAYLNFDR